MTFEEKFWSKVHSRQVDPHTSQEAGARVDLNKRCTEVLICISQQLSSPFTDGDIAKAMFEDRNIVARRRKDLTDAGLVDPWFGGSFHVGQQSRLGARGRHELLWCLNSEGADAAIRLENA